MVKGLWSNIKVETAYSKIWKWWEIHAYAEKGCNGNYVWKAWGFFLFFLMFLTGLFLIWTGNQ